MENNITDIVEILMSNINLSANPPNDLPPLLIAYGGGNKNGLSARKIVKKIISRKTEAGAPIGPLSDGSDSVEEKMMLIMVEEILEALIGDAKIQVAIPLGTQITATGLDATGTPVTVTGFTTQVASGYAIIQ
jgi:hypothetical protein